VDDFPRKLETYAGERGVKLSGGQKQRLAIARAIIRKPTLVFLDEATSALDSKAEKVVQEALDKMIDEHANGCTLIIAHRLSTLRTCNRIIVMDKGSIKESGTHDDLMSIEIEKDASGNMLKGWYRDLYETQHGKSEDKSNDKMLRAELVSLRQELDVLRKENFQLRVGKIKSSYLGAERRMRRILDELPQLNLVRHTSESLAQNGHDENGPPSPLESQEKKLQKAAQKKADYVAEMEKEMTFKPKVMKNKKQFEPPPLWQTDVVTPLHNKCVNIKPQRGCERLYSNALERQVKQKEREAESSENSPVHPGSPSAQSLTQSLRANPKAFVAPPKAPKPSCA